MEDVDEITCRICHSDIEDESLCIHPCKCKGSLRYTHSECLKEWLSLSKKSKCDICDTTFKFEKKFKKETPNRISFYYILLFLYKQFIEYFKGASILFYCVFKYVFILCLNTAIIFPFFDFSFFYKVLILGFFTFGGILNYQFFMKVISVISSIKIKLDSNTNVNQFDRNSSVSESIIEESDEALDSEIYLDLNTITFEPLSYSKLIDDIKFVFGSSSLSLFYPLINYLSKLVPLQLPKFIYQFKLDRFYLESLTTLFILYSLTFIAFLLKGKISFINASKIFMVLKAYINMFVLTTTLILSSGVFIGYLIDLKIPNYFNSIHSFIMFFLVGYSLSAMLTTFKSKLTSNCRPGFIKYHYKNEKLKTLMELNLKSSIFVHFSRLANFLIIFLALPYILYCINNKIISFFSIKIGKKGDLFIGFALLKIIMIYKDKKYNLGRSLADLLTFIFRKYSRIFNTENFVFNKPIKNVDKKYLVWDFNQKYEDPEYLNLLNKINKEKDDNKTQKRRLSHLENEETNDYLSQPENLNVENKNSRYEINSQNISKYLGKNVKKRISLFYKPRFYNLFLFISLFTFFFVIQSAFTISFIGSYFLVNLFSFKQMESFVFILLFFNTFMLIFNFDSSFLFNFKFLINNFLVLFYFNFMFPSLASLCYLFVFAEKGFINISFVFFGFFSVSPLISSLFEFLFIFSYNASTFILLSHLLSFFVLKLFLFLLFLFYKNLIRFQTFALPLLIVSILAIQVHKIVRILFSGNLMSQIKDFFFLEDTNILNYEEPIRVD